MTVIGIKLPSDQLVLTRGRDFRWAFENLDARGAPVDYPAGRLFFELDAGDGNAIQEVRVSAASGGTYKLGFDGQWTTPIEFSDVTVNPKGLPGDITDALEALPNIGHGNVFVHPAKMYPEWRIDLNLNTGHNEVQSIKITGNPTGGAFKLSYGASLTTAIPYNASASAVQSALQALPGIGAGNVQVTATPDGFQVEFKNALGSKSVMQIIGWSFGWDFGFTGGIFPMVLTSTLIHGSSLIGKQLVNVINKTVNDLFESFDAILGVDIEFIVHDNLNMTLMVRSRAPFKESDLLTFAVDVTADTIKAAFNAVSSLLGIFNTIHLDWYWNHVYRVEFVGELAQEEQPKLAADATALTSVNNDQRVEVSPVARGRFVHWPFVIDGSWASIKIESEAADSIPPAIHWQLVFLPDGEARGGDVVALGRVVVQS